MFKKTIIIFAALAATTVLNAQQALWDGAQVESPVLNEDGTVTFRYFAPKAVKVTVSGDFLPTQKIQTPFGEFDGPGVAELKEGEKGVWEYTTDFRPAPEMYTYTFNVDGLNVIDNNNMWVNRDVSSLTSAFIVPGGRADLYTIQDVPHGTVSKVWYDSAVAGFDRRLSVYTPAGYDPCGKTRYPVLYVLHGKGGADALVQQIAGEYEVQPGGGHLCLVAAEGEALLQHMALRLLPGLLPKVGILRDEVKAVFQRPLSLFFTHHAGGGDDGYRRRQFQRPPADFLRHSFSTFLFQKLCACALFFHIAHRLCS